MLRILNLSLLFAFMLVLPLFGCGPEPATGGKQAPIAAEPAQSAQVELFDVQQWFEAVGTVRPFVEISVEAQITGRVLEVKVRPGQTVAKGDELIRLDGGQSQSQLQQAGQGVNAAKAEYDRSKSAFDRMEKLYADKVVSKDEMEAAESAYLKAQADLSRLRGAAGEAGIGVGFTVIRAQADGEVAQRFVEPGDLAFPGKRLLTVQTSGALRLEALVREGLVGSAPLGADLPVVIDSIDVKVTGYVNELEPSADPATRSFVVKVSLPELAGLYPGMYAKLLVPTGSRKALVIPKDAVIRVGQLETVLVKTETSWMTVHVKTGQHLEQGVEVLSGLSEGDVVGLVNAAEMESGS